MNCQIRFLICDINFAYILLHLRQPRKNFGFVCYFKFTYDFFTFRLPLRAALVGPLR